MARHFVGIDLGTTNSALAYAREGEAEDAAFPPVHVLDIPQPVAEGRVEARRTLPSFLYLSEPAIAGAHAREQGALTPTKLIHSAKSWLSNPQVDRTAKILPWDASEGGRLDSPVDASARDLTEMRADMGTPPFIHSQADQAALCDVLHLSGEFVNVTSFVRVSTTRPGRT